MRIFFICSVIFLSPLALAHGDSYDITKSPAYPVGHIDIEDVTASPWDISLIESTGVLMVTSVGTNLGEKNGKIWKANPNDSKFNEVTIKSEESQNYYALSSHVYEPLSKRMFACSNTAETRYYNPPKNTPEIVYPSVVVFELSSDGSFVWVGSTSFLDKPGQHCGGVTIVNGIVFATNQYATDTSYPALYAADISSGIIPSTMSVVQSYSDLGYTAEKTIANHDLITSVRAKRTQVENVWSLYLLDSGRTRILEVAFDKEKDSNAIKRLGDIKLLSLPNEIKVPIALYNYDDSRFFLSADIVSVYSIRYDEEGNPEISWKAQAPSLVTGLAVAPEGTSQEKETNATKVLLTTSPVLVEGKYQISKFALPDQYK